MSVGDILDANEYPFKITISYPCIIIPFHIYLALSFSSSKNCLILSKCTCIGHFGTNRYLCAEPHQTVYATPDLRGWSLVTGGGGGGGTKWENRGSKTFCALPSRQGKTCPLPPFKDWKIVAPGPPSIWLPTTPLSVGVKLHMLPLPFCSPPSPSLVTSPYVPHHYGFPFFPLRWARCRGWATSWGGE